MHSTPRWDHYSVLPIILLWKGVIYREFRRLLTPSILHHRSSMISCRMNANECKHIWRLCKRDLNWKKQAPLFPLLFKLWHVHWRCCHSRVVSSTSMEYQDRRWCGASYCGNINNTVFASSRWYSSFIPTPIPNKPFFHNRGWRNELSHYRGYAS